MRNRWTAAWTTSFVLVLVCAGAFVSVARANPNCTTNNSTFNLTTQAYNLKGTMAGCVRGYLTMGISIWDDDNYINTNYPVVDCDGCTGFNTPSHSGQLCLPPGDHLHILVIGNDSNVSGSDYRQHDYSLVNYGCI
jgi:hypothetical protein